MRTNMYALLDLVAKTYTNPFHCHNDNEAKRLFMNWLGNPELPMYNNPQDFTLYHVGFYDTDSGVLESAEPHNLIMKGSSYEPPNNKPVLKEVVNNG